MNSINLGKFNSLNYFNPGQMQQFYESSQVNLAAVNRQQSADITLVTKEGDKVTLKEVNLVSDGKKVEIGTPVIAKAEVKATIKKQIKQDKVIAFKYKPKKRYRRKVGHRQLLTVLHLDKINMK